MKTQKTLTLTLATLVVLQATTASPSAAAANCLPPGSLDRTFVTTNSFEYTTNNPVSCPVRSLALDAEGRVYVAGDFTAFNGVAGPGLARLFPDGTADRSFQPPWSAGWL